MQAALEEVLETIIHDLAATAGPRPRIVDEDWTDFPGQTGAFLYAEDGSGQGIAVMVGDVLGKRQAELADQVQEWAVEELNRQGKAAVWPECPEHPDSHPLRPVHDGTQAAWRCPKSGHVVSPIGALPAVSERRL